MSIYELLNRIIRNEKYSLSSDLFIESDKKELTEEEKYIFELLKYISSLGTRIYNNGIEFHPMFVMADGSRSFSIEDISEDDYLLLSNLKLDKIPLILRALICLQSEIFYSLNKISAISFDTLVNASPGILLSLKFKIALRIRKRFIK